MLDARLFSLLCTLVFQTFYASKSPSTAAPFPSCLGLVSAFFFPCKHAFNLDMAKSTAYVGLEGPMQSVRAKKTTNDPIVAWTIVKNKTKAKSLIKLIIVNSMKAAPTKVVNPAAKMEGPK